MAEKGKERKLYLLLYLSHPHLSSSSFSSFLPVALVLYLELSKGGRQSSGSFGVCLPQTSSKLSPLALSYRDFKGSASQINKLVLNRYRNSVVLMFFLGLVINTYTNFQKTLPLAVSATTISN